MKLHQAVEPNMRFPEAQQRTAEYRMTIDELLMSLRSLLKSNSSIVIRQSFAFSETLQGQSFFLDYTGRFSGLSGWATTGPLTFL